MGFLPAQLEAAVMTPHIDFLPPPTAVEDGSESVYTRDWCHQWTNILVWPNTDQLTGRLTPDGPSPEPAQRNQSRGFGLKRQGTTGDNVRPRSHRLLAPLPTMPLARPGPSHRSLRVTNTRPEPRTYSPTPIFSSSVGVHIIPAVDRAKSPQSQIMESRASRRLRSRTSLLRRVGSGTE